jgi:hypothetical protein
VAGNRQLRAVIGARVSSYRDTSTTSGVTQLELDERHAFAKGWKIVGTLEDLGVSATVNPFDRRDLGP